MVRQPLRAPLIEEFHRGFDLLRQELGIADSYPADAVEEAEQARRATNSDRATERIRDARDIPFVTIDPASAMDLDQAYHAAPHGSGVRVHYAIADPATFVRPNGALERATLARGLTLYAPDRNTPLHPRVLSEQAASLLPDVDRPAVLWTVDLDDAGEVIDAHFERATVRSRAKLSYHDAQRTIDSSHGAENAALSLLREIGEARAELERRRGGVSINLPDQEVVEANGGYELRYDTSLRVEGWNAQISLMVGMIAGSTMRDAGIGLLRTLPDARPRDLEEIRRDALGLEIDWAPDVSYQDRVRELDPSVPDEAALLSYAVRALRGADYLALPVTQQPNDPPPVYTHWAIAGTYAHVTAPLRRVGDRYANEILLALYADTAPPSWASALEHLPEVLRNARRRERALERGAVDFVESMVLRPRIGEVFQGVVTGRRRERRLIVQLRSPAVIASVEADRAPGDTVRLRLVEADPDTRRIRFEIAERAHR